MLDSYDAEPTQYTSTFTSPNTTLTPALVLPTGSQGRQLSLTELDGTVHRFCYLVNGNYRLLDGGLTGTLRLGPVAVATTATVTAAVTVPDQTAGQTITLAGDETGTFSVGDFISPQANNFGAYRGIFIDSITFDGTNTVIVGPSNGATTFQTTSVLRIAGPADEVQGSLPTFSYDPDTSDAVYSTSVVAEEFTNVGQGITNHLTQIANAITALETNITWDGNITSTTFEEAVTTGSTVFSDFSSGTPPDGWSILSATSVPVVPTTGDAWTTIQDMYITENSSTVNRLYDVAQIGDSVRFTWGAGSASFPIISKLSRSTFLGTAYDIVGTIGRTFTDGENFTLAFQLISPRSSITLDLGTETNIDSSFTISGGISNMNTLVNTDGAPGVGVTVATTVTVLDPEATEVASANIRCDQTLAITMWMM